MELIISALMRWRKYKCVETLGAGWHLEASAGPRFFNSALLAKTTLSLADADLTTALRDAQMLEAARTCLEDTARRGSTAEGRAAAVAWLEEAARDEHQLEVRRPAPSRRFLPWRT